MSKSRRHARVDALLSNARIQSVALALVALPLCAHANTSSTAEGLVSLDRKEGGNESQSGFVVRNGVLWFADAKALETTYRTCAALDELARNVGKDDSLRRQAFEISNGFRSLATELDEHEFRITVRGTRLDELTMPDPTLQQLLSPDGEIAVASSLLIFDADGFHELSADALSAERTEAVVGSGRYFPLQSSSADSLAGPRSCWYFKVKVDTQSYDSGTRKLRGWQWVSNFTYFDSHGDAHVLSSLGARANNKYRKHLFWFVYAWVPESADSISVVSDLVTSSSCGLGHPLLINSPQSGSSSAGGIYYASPTEPRWVVDHFHSAFAVTDNGDSKSFSLDF